MNIRFGEIYCIQGNSRILPKRYRPYQFSPQQMNATRDGIIRAVLEQVDSALTERKIPHAIYPQTLIKEVEDRIGRIVRPIRYKAFDTWFVITGFADTHWFKQEHDKALDVLAAKNARQLLNAQLKERVASLMNRLRQREKTSDLNDLERVELESVFKKPNKPRGFEILYDRFKLLFAEALEPKLVQRLIKENMFDFKTGQISGLH